MEFPEVDPFRSGRPNIGIYMDEKCRRILGYIDEPLISTVIESEISDIGSLEEGKVFLKKDNKTYNSWCQDLLPPEYVKEELEDANLVLILRDGDGAIRGIALLEVGEEQMELLVLCSASRPASSKVSHKIYGRGTELLRLIQFLGKDFTKGIKLYALEHVIPLYYKFGWQFLFSCNAVERPYIEDAVKNLAEHFKAFGTDDTAELTGLLTGFKGRAKYITEVMREQGVMSGEALEEAREYGFEMLLCRDKNPYNVGEGKAEGYKRKKRKRRSRSRTRRTRRTRRNRRTRRTRRKPKKRH